MENEGLLAGEFGKELRVMSIPFLIQIAQVDFILFLGHKVFQDGEGENRFAGGVGFNPKAVATPFEELDFRDALRFGNEGVCILLAIGNELLLSQTDGVQVAQFDVLLRLVLKVEGKTKITVAEEVNPLSIRFLDFVVIDVLRDVDHDADQSR